MHFFLPVFLKWQTQFKSQGNKLVPDGVAEQALMYQRLFEGLTFYDKLGKTNTSFQNESSQNPRQRQNSVGVKMLLTNLLEYLLAAVIFYNWYVPEEERHDSALKRNKEALITELKLWEGYLEKVAYPCQRYKEPY